MDFRLLGPLEVWSEGRLLELRAKERTLLAVLLLHANETVSTERLIDELWGQRPPASATKLVATYVWQLRKALGEDTIATRPPGYSVVVSADHMDSARFEALVARAQTEQPAEAAATLREALALWRGPALAGVTFESSAGGDVARLDDQRLTVLAQRIDQDLALGRHEDVIGDLQALVRTHPFRERFRSQLMLSLYRAGRQADALEEYREARRRFVDELGIEPGPELQELERQILAHDPALEAPSATPVEPAAGTQLPRPASSFVGREREVGQLLSEVGGGARLLTLTGPGGAGKTRLALEAAHALAPAFADGAFWVGLASLRDHALVLEAVSQAVGARDETSAHIGERRLLILVDNLEHVIEAAPELAELVSLCPQLTMLVTSRERMHVQGELEYPVPPMSGSDAISLFCARAGVEASPEVEALCSRLDNLPLAVELAAGRAKALSPAQILERVSERLDLFRGARDADPRHTTLRATIEWSHDLLSFKERRLFARLAAFFGGCTYDAAAEVCEAGLDTLQALVEKSLVRFSNERYWMLETIRELAAERLAESGELDAVMERLARWLVDLAHAEGAPMFAGRGEEAYARLDLEHANVRSVIEWAVRRERFDEVAKLTVVYREVWTSRGNLIEVARWAEHAARAGGTVADELWPHVLLGVGQVRLWAGDRNGARAAMEDALKALAGVDSQPYLEATCLAELSWIVSEDGKLDEARAWAERSLALRVQHDLPTGRALLDLGHVALIAGDLEEARSMLEGARASFAEIGLDYNLAYTTRMLGQVARRRGDYDGAAALLDEALYGFAALHDVPTVAACLKDLAILAKERGDLDRAARLWGAGSTLSPSRPGNDCSSRRRLVSFRQSRRTGTSSRSRMHWRSTGMSE